jgi:hypothetical protein
MRSPRPARPTRHLGDGFDRTVGCHYLEQAKPTSTRVVTIIDANIASDREQMLLDDALCTDRDAAALIPDQMLQSIGPESLLEGQCR